MKDNTLKKKILAIAAIAVLALTGCGKGSVDISTSGAEKVPGAGNLYRLCDQSVLVYFSSIKGSSDEYEAFFYGACVWDKETNSFVPAIGAGTEPRTSPTDPANDEMNQQDERQEK
jgi:hypothetical protein